MKNLRVVLDTNVVVSALKSKQGTAFALFSLIGENKFELQLSVPLLLEYEKVLLDPRLKIPFEPKEIDLILNYVCKNATQHEIFYLWRPALPDVKDDMVLELAVASNAQYIVTYNTRDFRGCDTFCVKPITPKDFLKKTGVIT